MPYSDIDIKVHMHLKIHRGCFLAPPPSPPQPVGAMAYFVSVLFFDATVLNVNASKNKLYFASSDAILEQHGRNKNRTHSPDLRWTPLRISEVRLGQPNLENN